MKQYICFYKTIDSLTSNIIFDKISKEINDKIYKIERNNELKYFKFDIVVNNLKDIISFDFLPLIEFYMEHKDADYIWLIHDYVDFNGTWDKFFNYYNDIEDDFIASYIHFVSDKNEYDILPKSYFYNNETTYNDICSNNSIIRLSKKALETIIYFLTNNPDINLINDELFLPSYLYKNKCTIRSLDSMYEDFIHDNWIDINDIEKLITNKNSLRKWPAISYKDININEDKLIAPVYDINYFDKRYDMSSDLDIFICTNKEFESPITNPLYKIIDCGEINNDNYIHANTEDNIAYKGESYGYLRQMYWIWKNYPLKKYIGFCHSNKYFDFLDNIPDMNRIFDKDEYEAIIRTPHFLGDLFKKEQYNYLSIYEKYHSKEDWEKYIECIKEINKDFYDVIISFYNDTCLDSNQIFIMKSDDFKAYCELLFKINDSFDKKIHCNNYQDYKKYIIDNKNNYPNIYSDNKDFDNIIFQSKIIWHLSERLLGPFLVYRFENKRFLRFNKFDIPEYRLGC